MVSNLGTYINLSYVIADFFLLFRSNQVVRPSKLLHQLYSCWLLGICVVSDSWLSQLHLVRYCFLDAVCCHACALHYMVPEVCDEGIKCMWHLYIFLHPTPVSGSNIVYVQSRNFCLVGWGFFFESVWCCFFFPSFIFYSCYMNFHLLSMFFNFLIHWPFFVWEISHGIWYLCIWCPLQVVVLVYVTAALVKHVKKSFKLRLYGIWLCGYQTVSGRPPPAASMAVGQFFSPKEGELVLSPESLLLSMYSPMVSSSLSS